MAHDALGAHARDELGISETFTARPHPGSLGLGGQFRGMGAAVPIVVTAFSPESSDSSRWWQGRRWRCWHF